MSRKIQIVAGLGMVVVLLVLLLGVGCAEEAPTPGAPGVPDMEPQQWSIMITRSNLNAFDDAITQKAFDRIKDRTNGLLDIQTVFSGSLPIKTGEWLRAVSDRELEMCILTGDYHSPDFPLLGLIQTPFMFQNQVEKGIAIEATWPILQREANNLGIQLLTFRPYGEVGFWTTEPFDNIMDVGGAKLRAQAKVYSDMAEAINGVPVPVEWAEAYTSLQRGLVKGIFTGYDSVTGAKIHEVAISGTGKVALLEQRFWGTEEGRF